MTDLTRPDRGEARARFDDTIADLEPELALLYCKTVVWAIALAAPDVLVFFLDRADNALDDFEAILSKATP